MTVIVFFMCWGMVSLKDLSLLIVIAGYGVWTIISFVVFILVLFFYSISLEEFGHNLTLFEWNLNLGKLAGTGAMAFAVHINSASAVKCNRV